MMPGDLRARAKRIAARDPKTARLLSAAADRLFELPKLTSAAGRLTCGLCGETHDNPARIGKGAPEVDDTIFRELIAPVTGKGRR